MLSATVLGIGYGLIVYEKQLLTDSVVETVVLQGRNIALSSEKSLLRHDPEFELFPLVERLMSKNDEIENITIVDREGVIQGHPDLTAIATPHNVTYSGRTRRTVIELRPNEQLYERDNGFDFVTPIGGENQTGAVHLSYSNRQLLAGIDKSIRLTFGFTLFALLLGVGAALILFRRISQPIAALMEGVDHFAEGDLTHHIDLGVRNEFRVLAASLNDMATRVDHARRDMIAKERMEGELELAREIQQSLLPSPQGTTPGLTIKHSFTSAFEVGGDYVDYLPLPDGRTAIVVADVAGKGVPGLIVMAMVKVLVNRLLTVSPSPRQVIRGLNSAIQANTNKNTFVTAFVGLVDPVANTLVFSNAGHNPTLLYSAQTRKVSSAKLPGPPLGAFPSNVFDPTLDEKTVTLQPGDVILQYTDGLTESTNRDGDQFGTDRLARVTAQSAPNGPDALITALVNSEREFRGDAEQFDDITLLAFSLAPAAKAVTT